MDAKLKLLEERVRRVAGELRALRGERERLDREVTLLRRERSDACRELRAALLELGFIGTVEKS